jgi:hypothetical protein
MGPVDKFLFQPTTFRNHFDANKLKRLFLKTFFRFSRHNNILIFTQKLVKILRDKNKSGIKILSPSQSDQKNGKKLAQLVEK